MMYWLTGKEIEVVLEALRTYKRELEINLPDSEELAIVKRLIANKINT